MSEDIVLVSGASGYIGAHVVKTLQEAGYRVRGTVRSLKNEKKVDFLYKLCPNAKYPLELVEADLLNADSWAQAVNGCRYIMHTASPFPAGNPKHEDECIKPAVEGTLNVLRAAAEVGTVKRVVLTSSFVAVYDREDGKSGQLTEQDWSVPSKQEQAYSKSKTLAEKSAWDFIGELPQEKKMELCVINPVLVIGPALSGNPSTSLDLITNMMERKTGPFVPQFYLPVVDVRDVAKAHVNCLGNEQTVGNRHILFAENVYMPEVAKWVAAEFNPQGYSVPTRVLANPVLTIASWFSNDIKQARNFCQNAYDISNERLRQVLGINPRSAQESLLEMAYSLVEVGLVRKTEKYKGPPVAQGEN